MTISTGSRGQERYRRGNLARLVTGDPAYGRTSFTTCRFVRSLTPDVVDAVPCQVWNLMPLTALGAMAAGWLVLDLLGLDWRKND